MNLSELRTASRQRADEEADGFITNPELDNYINQGYLYIYTQMVQKFENYFIIPGDQFNGGMFNTANGQQLYPLPPLMHKLVKVEMREASSNDDRDWYRIRSANIANYDFSSRMPYLNGYTYNFSYFIAGNKIGFRPIPDNQNQTVRLWFVPSVAKLVNDDDEPVIPMMYHDFIADYAAIKCLSKSGEGIYQEKMNEFNISLANLLNTIVTRDQQAEQMTFVEDDGFFDLWANRFPWSN